MSVVKENVISLACQETLEDSGKFWAADRLAGRKGLTASSMCFNWEIFNQSILIEKHNINNVGK